MPDQVKGEVNTGADADTAKQPPTPPLPPAVEGHKDGKAGDDETNRNQVEKTYVKPKHWTKYVETICAVALVFITAYYTRAAYRQAQASEIAANAARDAVKVASNTLAETLRSNTRQETLADDARIASQQDAQNAITASQTASQKAIQATQDSMRQDQRAWIGVEDIEGEPKKGQPINIRLVIKNTGKTPATNVRVWHHSNDYSETPDIRVACRSNLVLPSPLLRTPIVGNTMINPGATIETSFQANGQPLEKDIDDLIGPGRRYYAVGCMLYDDVFSNPHWVTFCTYWDKTVGHFVPCEKYNETGDGQWPQ